MFIYRVIALSLVASAQLALPPNDGFFTDTVGLIQPEQEEVLEKALSDIADSTGQFIVVVFLEGLYGGDPSQVAKNIQKEWDLPKNSVMLLFGYEDRKAHVEAGLGVRDVFEETVTKGIAEKDVLPRVREGEYGKAILDGVESIMKHMSGQYTAERYIDNGVVPKSLLVVLLYAVVVLFGLSWVAGTLTIFKTGYKYSIAGTLLGPVVGVLLLEKYGMWLSIPPFLILGALSDYVVFRLYRSYMPQKRRRKRRR